MRKKSLDSGFPEKKKEGLPSLKDRKVGILDTPMRRWEEESKIHPFLKGGGGVRG